MKITIPAILLSLCLLILLSSCSNTKEVAMQRRQALNDSKVSDSCFVQLNDGTIKNYTSLQLVTGVYKSPHLLADGKTRISPDEIMAYQNKDHFAISATQFSYGGHKSNLATETLPGFAVRIASGRLNVYIKKYKENNKVIDEYFLQEADGQVLVYTPELMDALIKNEPEALDFFNNNRKHIKLTQELKATAKIYNDAYFKQTDDKRFLARADKRKVK